MTVQILNLKKVLIIAEACDNHFGKLNNAKQMVVRAKAAGADVIKFQHHLPDEEMLKIVPKSSNFKMSLYDFLKKYSLKLSDHVELKKFCKKIGIHYLCTPFSYKAAQELNRIGVQWFKIGSGEFTDTPFIKKVLKFNKPVIFSTGMSTLDEIEMIHKIIRNQKNKKIAFMNCTSEYPPILKDLNLGFIPKLIKKFPNLTIGHSDHTNDILSSIGAVALGAKIIEKHVNLDNKNYGPDRDVSISFKKFNEMVTSIRALEQSLGDSKKVYKKEKQIRKWAHRSIVSVNDIQKNQIIKQKDIWSKRPGTGIPSRYMNKVIGKKAKKFIKKNTLLTKSQIGIKI
jgi:sialic acid synthase SpsE|tara:strand:+ start:57 stop:1079 length:1023 start_codon:yes stop_codon:yes gene_type:complete